MKKILISLIICGICSSFAVAESDEDTWNLADLYANLEEWQQAKSVLSDQIAGIDSCKGQLGDDAVTLLKCAEMFSKLQQEFNRWAVYAFLEADADTRVSAAQERRQEVQILDNKMSRQLSFVSPEILFNGKEKMEGFFAGEADLAPYRHGLDDILRQADHTLDEAGERLMAATSLLRSAPGDTYRTLTNAELPWPTVTLSDGTQTRLDAAGYTRVRGVNNRSDRKLVFDTFWLAWGKYRATLGSTLSANVQAHIFNSQSRNYQNPMAAALAANNIPETVYRTLLSETNANLDTLHRYFRLRARMLGIDDMQYHDIYPPLVSLDKKFPIEVGKQLTLEAVKPLGGAYGEVIAHGFNSRWMDVYPREGKRSGAYMSGSAYDVHPYVLMNYNDDYESVSTLAHEWGHAMHSYLAAGAQPYPTYGYATFTAEIASTFNEALLLDYMLGRTGNDEEKLYYLGSALENLRGTYFRQAMFAEFELAMHEKALRGEALSGDSLTALYAGILKRYHGHDEGVVNIDDSVTMEWAYIPHFYLNFYVYQYATSLAASSLLAESVLRQEPGAVERYLDLLRAGGSDYPYDLLKKAGVDMATPAPYRAVVTRMNRIMDEIESILDRGQTVL